MAHLLETSILNLSVLIERNTNKEKLVDYTRTLASWSNAYSPKNGNYESSDQQYLNTAIEIKDLLKD